MSWKKGQAVRLLPLSQATGRVLEIYRDVQCVFGVPHISSFFQFLGTQPRFLESFWVTIRPIVQSQAFFDCAHRLRADSYSRVHSTFEVPDLKAEVARQEFSLGAREELKNCINFFCYSVPISLLMSSMLSESFIGPVGNPEVPLTPAPRPKSNSRIVLVDEDSAGPAVKAIFADIRTATNADVVHTVYRAFARWPDFLQLYWAAVKPLTVSELFQQSENGLLEDARNVVKEVPGPVQFTSADLEKLEYDEAEVTSLIGIADMFVHSLSAAMLNVSVARIAMEGGSIRLKPTTDTPVTSTQSS